MSQGIYDGIVTVAFCFIVLPACWLAIYGGFLCIRRRWG